MPGRPRSRRSPGRALHPPLPTECCRGDYPDGNHPRPAPESVRSLPTGRVGRKARLPQWRATRCGRQGPRAARRAILARSSSGRWRHSRTSGARLVAPPAHTRLPPWHARWPFRSGLRARTRRSPARGGWAPAWGWCSSTRSSGIRRKGDDNGTTPGVVERNDEKVGMLELAQKLAGTLHLKDLVAKRSRQLLQHGGPDHETSLFLGNGGQDFLRKQVDYIATATSERRDVGVRVPSPHGEGCEVDPRGPPLGALEQPGHVVTVHAEPQP